VPAKIGACRRPRRGARLRARTRDTEVALPALERRVDARLGALGVYATAVELRAIQRTRGERAALTALTLAGGLLLAPLAFLIPPHLESGAIAFLLALYFARRAWVGEWHTVSMAGPCPRCDATVRLKPGTVLYLPHTLHCDGCRAELWLEIEAAPDVPTDLRQQARQDAELKRRQELSARPPKTWSPASSDWGRD
jgi:hypothetical protein